jgi:hypothetical protein
MARTGATPYTLGSPTRRCAATGRELATGEPYIAALVQGVENEGFERVDFAEDVWRAGARPRPPAALLGYWHAVVPEPGARKRLLVDDASLIELFEGTDGAAELDPAVIGEDGSAAAAPTPEDRLAFRFILGLILLRKKLLICEKTVGTTMHVRPRGSPKAAEGGELMELVDPGMDAAAVARVAGSLAAVLEG